MKTGSAVAIGVAAVIAIAAAFYMIDVDQTEEARLPDVEVNVEGGQLPEFDAEVGSVELTEESATVKVPDVDVEMKDAEITVPGIEVTPPEDAGTETAADN
ncbi:hypothetical protein N6L27_16830 [Leisingera sp. SS27]|uniref:hypothetical protein n=1 Tax=Leisingera sp. SS27 TaxID=2979462 RepID=UPI00232FDBEB|nr:hypothetical protein [Leisingera sp. SS27]MDC0659669.1 hypothetical protein [Leisingera sp. SS27]